MRTMRLPRTADPAVSVSIVCLALAAVAELWLARRAGPAFVVAVVIAGLAVVWAVVLSVRPKDRPAAASGDGAGPMAGGDGVSSPGHGEPDAGLAARRRAVASSLAEIVDANLAALIVEAVAVQQALVRDAHPDDVLVRMQAVEEGARAASADLRRLLSAAALTGADHAGHRPLTQSADPVG